MTAAVAYPEVGHELADYWTEYHDLAHHHTFYEEPQNYEEGEQETEWLIAAGLAQLAAPFQAGREITELDVSTALKRLPRAQAEAARKRVRHLNRTLRRQRTRRPDIRDVFRDHENSSGSEPRSRSATPDSLDSLPSGGSGSPPTEWADPPLTLIDTYPVSKQSLHRTTSAPLSTFPHSLHRDSDNRNGLDHLPSSHLIHVPVHELFKPSELHWADVASNTEGIELLGYQRFGTIQGPRLGRERIITNPIRENDILNYGKQLNSSIVKIQNITPERIEEKSSIPRVSSQEFLSFEQKFKKDSDQYIMDEIWPEEGFSVNIDDVLENQLRKLLPLVWLDLTALYDRYNLPFQKRKPYKRKKKEENNVFGVSLSTLVRRDNFIADEADSNVPKILRLLLEYLKNRVNEEGILRVAGNKHKVESLCHDIEQNFYRDPQTVEKSIENAGCHDIAATLKRFLRELPQPILTTELVQLFYQTHALDGAAQGRALNLLILLMPIEHRATLLEILKLMIDISQCHSSNKMTEHNVAMIIAPTFFPPSLIIRQTDGLEAQVQMAANSCHVTEALMKYCENLWFVPPSLLSQLDRKMNMKRNIGYVNS